MLKAPPPQKKRLRNPWGGVRLGGLVAHRESVFFLQTFFIKKPHKIVSISGHVF